METKTFFHFLTNTAKQIRWLNGSKFKFPKWSTYQYSTVEWNTDKQITG